MASSKAVKTLIRNVRPVGGPAATGALPRLTSVTDRPGLEAGDPASWVILDGETPTAAVMDRLPDRTVIHRGKVVAEGLRTPAPHGE